MRVPLGVVGIIYESRPNVTADAAALCLKSGNATILRGGSEAIRTNQAIAACVHKGLRDAGVTEHAVQVVATTDRAAVGCLIADVDHVDVIVPRGGKGLIERISKEARVPVIKHLDGVCHVFIDATADVGMAVRIADNAKTQRYSPCNTMETLLVHEAIAERVLPPLAEIYGGEIRRVARLRALACDCAGDEGGDRGRLVHGIPGAHPRGAGRRFARRGDGAHRAVRLAAHGCDRHRNTPTRCAFCARSIRAPCLSTRPRASPTASSIGLGAEIGISTNKLHARGPVGLEGLTSQKWVVLGTGQVRT